MKLNYSQTFSKRGIVIGGALLVIEYITYSLFYSYANPDLWENVIPHKYILGITLFLGGVIAFIVASQDDNHKELANIKNFSAFNSTILTALGLSIFGTGTFILYNILKAKIFNSFVIGSFIDNNLYVHAASSWVNLLNQILYPILATFIFQGFLLNGLAREMGFKKSNIVTSIFYGYWFGDIIGGTIYNLFLNQVYYKTKNIFYPGLITAAMNLIANVAYLINDEMWLLKPHSPDYNDEIIKGILLTIVMIPIAFKVIREALKTE